MTKIEQAQAAFQSWKDHIDEFVSADEMSMGEHQLYKAYETIKTALAAYGGVSAGETCILEKDVRSGFFTTTDTVICGQSAAEYYLRKGYHFNWEKTDAARTPAPKGQSDE